MSREKQIIKEIAKDLCQNTMCNLDEWNACSLFEGVYCVRCLNLAERLYNAGYRKQSEGEWIKDEKSKFEHRYYCSACNFYLFGAPTNYCEECGAKMKGGAK